MKITLEYIQVHFQTQKMLKNVKIGKKSKPEPIVEVSIGSW